VDGTFEEIAEAFRVDDRGSGMNVRHPRHRPRRSADVFVSDDRHVSKTLRFVVPREDVSFTSTIASSNRATTCPQQAIVSKTTAFADKTTARNRRE